MPQELVDEKSHLCSSAEGDSQPPVTMKTWWSVMTYTSACMFLVLNHTLTHRAFWYHKVGTKVCLPDFLSIFSVLMKSD